MQKELISITSEVNNTSTRKNAATSKTLHA